MSNRVFVCPVRYTGHVPAVFLAGGITGCPDWQGGMAKELVAKCPRLVVLNPRRDHFDVSDASAHDEQIQWEFDALRQASVVLFWFPRETLCPITLYELGAWSALHRQLGTKIVVGCHPDYARRRDVETQLRLAVGPDFVVHSSLGHVAEEVVQWWDAQVRRLTLPEPLPETTAMWQAVQAALDYVGALEEVYSNVDSSFEKIHFKYDAPLDTHLVLEQVGRLMAGHCVPVVAEFVRDGRKSNTFSH